MAEYDVDEKICKYYRKNGVTVKAEITGDLIRCGECRHKEYCCRTIHSEGRTDEDYCSAGER